MPSHEVWLNTHLANGVGMWAGVVCGLHRRNDNKPVIASLNIDDVGCRECREKSN